jgi:hypothetical protein
MYAPGHFAVKKIAVGDSHQYLMEILREACHHPCLLPPLTLMSGTQIRLLEQLRHPNIVSYHHAWIEPTRFSSFGPRVPTLQCVYLRLRGLR